MIKKIVLPSAALVLLTASSFAAHAQTFKVPGPTYSYIQGYYHNLSVSDADLQFKGPGIQGEYQLSSGLFVMGDYRQGSDNDSGQRFSLKSWAAGVGTYHQVNRQTTLDLILMGGQQTINAKGVVKESVDYYALQGGIRRRVNEFVEVKASYRFIDYQDSGIESDNSFSVEAIYHVDPDFGFHLSFRNLDEGNLVQAGVSYKF